MVWRRDYTSVPRAYSAIWTPIVAAIVVPASTSLSLSWAASCRVRPGSGAVELASAWSSWATRSSSTRSGSDMPSVPLIWPTYPASWTKALGSIPLVLFWVTCCWSPIVPTAWRRSRVGPSTWAGCRASSWRLPTRTPGPGVVQLAGDAACDRVDQVVEVAHRLRPGQPHPRGEEDVVQLGEGQQRIRSLGTREPWLWRGM